MTKLKETICTVLFGLLFLALLGIAGGLDAGTIGFGQAVLWGAVILMAMFALIVVGRLYESEDE